MHDAIVPVPRVTTLDEEALLTLAELCRAAAVEAEAVRAMVEEGILEPVGKERHEWRFPGTSLRRVRLVVRLQEELHVNLPGAALVLELLERIEELESRLRVAR